ncbi:MAG: hypothetical protein GY768_04055 [Planctomycetaceae bacterium]|nr:hypothetical protein [Planctomycetaceae bacterium]
MWRNTHRVVVLELKETLGVGGDFRKNGFTAVDQLAAERLGISGFQDYCWEITTLEQTIPFFQTVLSQFVSKPSDDLVAEFADCFKNSQPIACLPSKTVRRLKALRQVTQLAVLADGPFLEQKAKCLSLNLGNLVDRIVYPDYWGRGFRLPHPRGLMSIQNCDNLVPERCLFVAATRNRGFRVAQRLGWQTICLSELNSRIASGWWDAPLVSLASLSNSGRDEPNAA